MLSSPPFLNDTDIFSKYDLRTLHTLAAEGLAESCWALYDDQPSGLGPEQAIMRQGITWFEELRRWHAGGAPGTMPGMGEKGGRERVREPGIEGREYTLRRQPYLLRPEVRFRLSLPLDDMGGAWVRVYACMLMRSGDGVSQTVESLFMLWKTTRDPKWRERAWAVFEALEREARTEAGYAVVGDVQSARGVRRDEMPRCVSRFSRLCRGTASADIENGNRR